MTVSGYKFDDPKAAFAEADRSIQNALKTGAIRLNLSDFGLTELPESIGDLPELQELILGGNRLKTLPVSIGNLKQLHALYAPQNKLGSSTFLVGS